MIISVRHFVGLLLQCCVIMESDYYATLDLEAMKRYKEKLKLESEELADPYALSENEWCDDITSG